MSQKLGRELKELLDEIDEVFSEYDKKPHCGCEDKLFLTVTKEQTKQLNSIQDTNVKEFIKELAKSDYEKMEISLQIYSFLEKHFTAPPKQKNHTRAYVLKIFNEIENNYTELTKKEHIQLTADKLNITFNAIKNHIYRKKQK